MARCLCTFEVTTMALLFERQCRAAGFAVRVVPVPRQISASCGLACCYPCQDQEALKVLCRERAIEVSQWHRLEA